MKYFSLIAMTILFIGCNNDKKTTLAEKTKNSNTIENLVVVDQNYKEAMEIASKENKLIFIDFYTTWCAPCKKLDKAVFKNDSIQKILNQDFILLKYDAENDSIFHLSKKYHINGYPTGLILNNDGYLIDKQTGFLGEDKQTLQTSLLQFTNESVLLHKENRIIKGYSNTIDASKYPKFYVDYVNRTNTKINPQKLNEYWKNYPAIFSEEYFSSLAYFAREASEETSNKTLNNKKKYIALYGKKDVGNLVYFLVYGKFNRAIKAKSQVAFDEAVVYAEKSFDNEKTFKNIVSNSKKDFLKARNKWDEVFEINNKLKEKGDLSNGYINHFSWQVYKGCDNQEVIKKCLNWMEEVTNKEPSYDYLDTYAFLMHKSGNKKEAKRIAKLAIEAGKKEDRKTSSTEKLLQKL